MRPPESPACPPARRRRRVLAALVALTFGCTTVRAPASALGADVPVREGRAEPQVELWVESGEAIAPEEAATAAREARAALEEALAGREADDADTLLVVRAQGVTRTPSRRSDQRAAVAGMVVGAVVIVAAVVIAVVTQRGSGGKGAAPSRARPGPAAQAGGPVARAPRPGARVPSFTGARPQPVAAPARAVPRPLPPIAPGPRPLPRPAPVAPAPYPAHAYHGPNLWLGFGFFVDLTPGPEPVRVQPPLVATPPPPRPAEAEWVDEAPERAAAGAGEDAPDAPAASSPELTAVVLPPPEPLAVDERGFFAKDQLRLELWVVDRATGEPLWMKVTDGRVDPRDAAAVKKLLDRALAERDGWLPPPR